jgi:hypothetical protein
VRKTDRIRGVTLSRSTIKKEGFLLYPNACNYLPSGRKRATVLPRQHLPARRSRQRTTSVNRILERRTSTRVAFQPNAECASEELPRSREELG